MSVRGITKTYGGTAALRDVSLDVRPGEVHALLGCNGSGKSTLIKVLAGIARADDGTVAVRGTRLAASDLSPGVAHREGLRFVHQTPVVFEALTVADNLAVTDGFPHSWAGSVDGRELRRRAEQAIERFGLDVSPGAPVAMLRPAQRVMLSIARALHGTDEGRSCLVVLDEPTAVLQGSDCDDVLGWMRRLAQEGHGVVFVSHRLDEVRQVCDRATVLRDGRVSGVVDGDLTRARVLDLMVGESGDEVVRSRDVRPPGEVVLQVRDLASGPLESVTLDVRRGEVVGVAGLVGSGRTTLLETIYGARRPRAGHIDLAGHSQRPRSPRAALAAGIAYVPEDREAAGVFPGLGVRDNLLVPAWSAFWRRLHMDDRSARRETAAAITDFGVVCADDSTPITSLSGGNQQKVVIARWIRTNPLLLLLDEPTQGVDVSARAGIHAIVREYVASDRAAALVVSSDHDELVELCDRVVVIADGVVVSEVSGDDLTASHLTRLTHSTKEDR